MARTPTLLDTGKPRVGDADITTMADIVRLEVVRVDMSGPDVRIIACPQL
ncbi:hypothetical protein M8C13_05300 [Crossiella sp. SN42]|nr:hypothetical protein [Crossiella sp. SN42]MCO1575175.1 hypothetical protein [Crossiella sp. SN42]